MTFNRSSNKNTIGLQDVQSLNLEQKYVQFSRSNMESSVTLLIAKSSEKLDEVSWPCGT